MGEGTVLFAKLAILLLLGVGLLWDGLYSPAAHLVAAGLLALAFLALNSRERMGERQAVDHDQAVRLGPGELLSLAVITAGAALSLWQPAATGLAAHGPGVVLGWLLALALGRLAAQQRWLEPLLATIWSWSGPLVLVAGLALLDWLPVHHSGRVASVLGYPIAVGVLGMLGLGATLGQAVKGAGSAVALLLYGNLAAVLLSGSRGVWVATALLLGYLLWAAPGLWRRPGRLALVAAAALAAAVWVGPAVAAGRGWTALGSLLAIGLTLAAVARFQWRPLWELLGGLFFLAVAAVGPGSTWLIGRATLAADGSAVERLTFLQDGLRLIGQHPWGAGYRSWTALHLQGASYGYYSAEAHSALVDLALGFGWLGGTGFVGLLLHFWWRLRHGRDWGPVRAVVLGSLGALSLHSLVDWNLSYGLFAVPLWMGIGLAGGGPDNGAGMRIPRGLLAGVAGLALAWLLLVGVGDALISRAEGSLRRGEVAVAHRQARLAASVAPWDENAHAALAQARHATGDPGGALTALRRARQLGPREPFFVELEAEWLRSLGHDAPAAVAYVQLVELWPWEISAYERALTAIGEMLLSARLRGDSQATAELAGAGRAVLRRLDAQKAREPVRTPRQPLQVDSPAIRQARVQFEP